MAALIAAAQLPPPEPVPPVSYRVAGRVLVIGAADAAAARRRACSPTSSTSRCCSTAARRHVPQERTLRGARRHA